MKRIQFYPNSTLNTKLEADAKNRNLSTSALVVDILNAYYGLSAPNTLLLADLIKKVFDEVSDYIADPKAKPEFALRDASPTYDAIEMTGYRKPRIIRAKIGAAFSRVIGKPGPFSDIAVIRMSNGKIKTNINDAALYKIVPPVLQPIQSDIGLDFCYELRDNIEEDVGRIICREFLSKSCVQIDSFCVSFKWRRKKLGKKLFMQVVSDAIEKGYKYISVFPQPSEVYDDIEPMSKEELIQIYSRLGFTHSTNNTELIYRLQ